MKENKSDTFERIIDLIKINQNYTINCKVIKEAIKDDLIFMTVIINDIENAQFFRKKDNLKLIDKNIFFDIENLGLNVFNGVNYFYIKKYKIQNEIRQYNFDKIKIYDSFDKLNNNKDLFNIKLKAKEECNSLSKTKFIFQDIFGKIVKVNINKNYKNYKFEHGKIYFFNGYLFNNENQEIVPTFISTIQEYLNDNEKIRNFKEISSLRNEIISFKGEIVSYKIVDKYIIIKDFDNNETYKLFVNFDLTKKISINSTCKFYNFLKINNNEFKYTNFSEIESQDKTYIEFKFLNFNKNKNFFNKIIIDDKTNNIEQESFKIQINDNDKTNIFIQKICFQKVEVEQIKESYEISLEVNKGKINYFYTGLENDKYSYQLYINSRKKEDLPHEITIKINNKDIILKNSDKFGNELSERFTIINIPMQNIDKIFKLPTKKKILMKKK